MRDSFLKSAESMLKKQKYHTRFADNNLLELSKDKNSKVFAFLIIEKDQFPGIILSLSLDFPETYVVAELVINLMHIAPVALGEAFYRSKNGTLYWEEDALKYFSLEYDNLLLNDLSPATDSLH